MSDKVENKGCDAETAELEFEKFCDAWEIDNDTAGMNDEDKTAFEGQKAKIINSIKRGRFLFESDKVVYTVSDKTEKHAGEKITIERPKGAALMEMDKYKDREGVHKTYSVLAAMSGKEPKFISWLDGIDVKPLLAVVTLFLAS